MIRTIVALRCANGRFPPRLRAPAEGGPQDAVCTRIAALRSGVLDADRIVTAAWPDKAAAIRGIADLAADHEIAFAAEVDTRTYTVGGNPANGPIPVDAYKVMFAYRLPGGVDPDWFWRYHTEIHGPEVVEAGGDLIVGYALSRRLDTIAGDAAFFALIELWWKNEDAVAAYAARSDSYVTRSGKAPLDDWASHKLITAFAVQLDAPAR